MKNNADKNNTRELNLPMCSGIYQLSMEFDLFLLIIIIFLNLKQGRGKNGQETAYSITKRKFKTFARRPFYFAKYRFITSHFH